MIETINPDKTFGDSSSYNSFIHI